MTSPVEETIAASRASLDRLRRRSDIAADVVSLSIGGAALALDVEQLASTASMVSRTGRATGVYVGSVDRIGGLHGGTFHHARYRFQSADGRTHYATEGSGSTQDGHASGDTATIRYDPAAPDKAMVCSFWTLGAGPLFCGIFALAFGVPGFLLLLRQRRRARA